MARTPLCTPHPTRTDAETLKLSVNKIKDARALLSDALRTTGPDRLGLLDQAIREIWWAIDYQKGFK